jgi:type IV secretion system protein VirD4
MARSKSTDDLLGIIAGLACVTAFVAAFLLWLAGQVSGLMAGKGWPDSSPLDIPSILGRWVTNPSDPAAAWPAAAAGAIGSGSAVLTVLLVLLVPAGVLGFFVSRLVMDLRRIRVYRYFRLGFASRYEVGKLLGERVVKEAAERVRPSFRGRTDIDPKEVGYLLGRDIRSGRKVWASVEESMIVVAPPRAGKDASFCTPLTIDAPGPVLVTTTKPEAFTATYAQRASVGKVHVYDPWQRVSWPNRLQWSPITASKGPSGASYTAAVLLDNGGFPLAGSGTQMLYINQATMVMRCYLLAANYGRKNMLDLITWARNPDNPEPIDILAAAESSGAIGVVGWSNDLQTLLALDPRDRGNIWTVVTQSLGAYTEPLNSESVMTGPDEPQFDVVEFLSGRNTLYIIAKDQRERGGVSASIIAMVDWIFDEARAHAQRSPGGRLDPPFTAELNDVVDVAPLGGLATFMSDNGRFSIATHVYLQSMSQARAKWGSEKAMSMWANAGVRVVMGGGGDPGDLKDISDLLGPVPGGSQPVMSVDELRTMRPETAIVVARSARPVEMRLTPWWKRDDGKRIAAGKEWTERQIENHRNARSAAERNRPRPGFPDQQPTSRSF